MRWITSLALLAALSLAGPLAADDDRHKPYVDAAREALGAIGQAVRSDDYATLRGRLSSASQREHTAASLKKALSGLKGKVDLRGVVDTVPRLGVLTSLSRLGDRAGAASRQYKVSGYWPTKPDRLRFELRFLEEGGSWRLDGWSLVPVSAQVPEDAVMRRLIVGDARRVEQAALDPERGRDALIARMVPGPKTREPAKLDRYLALLFLTPGHAEGLTSRTIVWRGRPTLHDDGTLTASGRFAGSPKALFFDIGWIEGARRGDWLLRDFVVTAEAVGPLPSKEKAAGLARRAVVDLVTALHDPSKVGALKQWAHARMAKTIADGKLAEMYEQLEGLAPDGLAEAACQLTKGPVLREDGSVHVMFELAGPKPLRGHVFFNYAGDGVGYRVAWILVGFDE